MQVMPWRRKMRDSPLRLAAAPFSPRTSRTSRKALAAPWIRATWASTPCEC